VLAWPSHTQRFLRRPNKEGCRIGQSVYIPPRRWGLLAHRSGGTLTLFVARCGWTRRGGAWAWASTSRRGGGASRCGGRARWRPHRVRVSARRRTGPRGAETHLYPGRHVPSRRRRHGATPRSVCHRPARAGSALSGCGARGPCALWPASVPCWRILGSRMSRPREHVAAHLCSYHPSRLHSVGVVTPWPGKARAASWPARGAVPVT